MQDSTPARFDSLGLGARLVRNLARMGYAAPRPVQAAVIPAILAGGDVIGLAQTGTGKTAAFAAPLAQRLLDAEAKRAPAAVRAVVLCPTRELARQVARETAAIVKGSSLRVECVYGKVALGPQRRRLERPPRILIATPGRLRELLDLDAVSVGSVRIAVIDEADRMLDMGFLPQVTHLLARMPPAPQRQTLLFTATMPEAVEALARRFLLDPQRLEIGRHTTTVEHVRQHVVEIEDRDKVALVLNLLETWPRRGVLIFCATRRRVGWVGEALRRHGLEAGLLHGDRSQAQRQRALEGLMSGRLAVAVATDVAARGLHIPAVRAVINYDLPPDAEQYVHRVGRAAHGGGSGECFSLVSRRHRQAWQEIAETVGLDLEFESIPGFVPTAPRGSVKPRTARQGQGRTISSADDHRLLMARDQPEGRRGRSGRTAARPRRSRRGRPIRPGEKPGGGVRRLTS
jgi:ATP-dependent RNA helicase RhlE